MHKCPQRCKSHDIFGKTNAPKNIRFFQMKIERGPCSNSAIKSIIQSTEHIKKHAHKCPMSGADHLHEKMLQPQTTSLGSSHTHVIARKACYTMFIINRILSHIHRCANSCHETSSTLSMDNGSMHWAICQCCSHTLALHFYHLDMHYPHSCLSSHHNLPYQQHSLQPHSEEEFLPPPYTQRMLMCTKEFRHPDESNMVSKCKHTKEDDQETNAGQYPFLALLFHIQENANTTLLASKHNTSACLLQETCSFYWQNALMHKCPQRCQSQGMGAKTNAPNNIRVFQMKSEWGLCSNSEINLGVQPSELIKKHAHECPISGADHLHVELFRPQTTPLGSTHAHMIARKACSTMFIINRILSPHAWMCKLMP